MFTRTWQRSKPRRYFFLVDRLVVPTLKSQKTRQTGPRSSPPKTAMAITALPTIPFLVFGILEPILVYVSAARE